MRIRWFAKLLFCLLCCLMLLGCDAKALQTSPLEKAVIQRLSTQGSVQITDPNALDKLQNQLRSLDLGSVCDTPNADPVMMLVLYYPNEQVQTVLTYGEYLEIDGVTYLSDEITCRNFNALLWQLLYP